MRGHNICYHGDLRKKISELSSKLHFYPELYGTSSLEVWLPTLLAIFSIRLLASVRLLLKVFYQGQTLVPKYKENITFWH